MLYIRDSSQIGSSTCSTAVLFGVGTFRLGAGSMRTWRRAERELAEGNKRQRTVGSLLGRTCGVHVAEPDDPVSPSGMVVGARRACHVLINLSKTSNNQLPVLTHTNKRPLPHARFMVFTTRMLPCRFQVSYSTLPAARYSTRQRKSLSRWISTSNPSGHFL